MDTVYDEQVYAVQQFPELEPDDIHDEIHGDGVLSQDDYNWGESQ